MDPKFLRTDLETGYIARVYYKFDQMINYISYIVAEDFFENYD